MNRIWGLRRSIHSHCCCRLLAPTWKLAVLLVLFQCFSRMLAGQAHTGTIPKKNPSNAYVGSESCQPCHAGIYGKFRQSSMGRSLSPVTPEWLHRLGLPAHSFNAALDRHFDVFTREGKLYQSEYQIALDRTEIFRDTREIKWLVGAGENGIGALVQQDGYLFQAPQSFYSQTNSWSASPGYDSLDLGFNRPIQAGCISCHSGRSRPISAGNGRFEQEPFAELGIGCENCHGPGGEHVLAMKAPGKSRQSGASIVNPAKLTPYLADNICMMCHQTGDARILKEGKSYQDFRPGEALDKTLSILMVPPTPQHPPDSDHVEHYYSMTLSKCYRQSQGRMSCITCHDPHQQPAKQEAAAYFTAKCLNCHKESSCKLPLHSCQERERTDGCIGCHMPRRAIGVISHSSATNHRILSFPEEPFPPVTFQQTIPTLPDLIHLNPAPGAERTPLPLLTLLEAYGELAATRSEYVEPYLRTLGELEKSQPNDPLVQASLGRRELKNGNTQAAVEHLQQALELGSLQSSTYSDLADAMEKSGKPAEALQFLEKAVALDPFNPVLRKTLIVRLIQQKQFASAQTSLRKYLEIFPQDFFMRQMLAQAEGRTLPKTAK